MNEILASDETQDDPPPVYGDIHGTIGKRDDGVAADVSVTENGRVDISINQFNRRFSQLVAPSLRHHQQDAQDDANAPPGYPLGSQIKDLRPPCLNIVIQVVGSRGDVQPFVALGKVLKNVYGHRVRLATHPIFAEFVRANGLEFFSIGGDPSRLMAFMVKNVGLMPGFHSVLSGDIRQRRRDVAEYMQGCWRSCFMAGNGMEPTDKPRPDSIQSESSNFESTAKPFVADCIIANPPSFAHVHCAEKLGIPLQIMFTMPYSPTQAFPHPLANIKSSNAEPEITNYLSYAMIEALSWQGLGDVINRFRARCLGLDPVSLIWAPGMIQRLKVPHTYCWSPALIPKPRDWGSHISVSGFFFLDSASDYTPSPDLETFLKSGPPPVYIGFGSIVLSDPDAMTQLVFEAIQKTGQRCLLAKGWGGIASDKLNVPSNIFVLGDVPHDWLFKHVSCIVHHGGAGTTAAGMAAGKPTVVIPFFGDQPFWGAMVARAGAGPDPIPYKQLTAENLAAAIEFCLQPDCTQRAAEMARQISLEDGCIRGTESFHQHLPTDRLCCSLMPSRTAVWRVRRTEIRLSAFAACTLVNARVLDFKDLKLYRPQEYETDRGPWDPLSGMFVAACGAFSGMALGIAEIPSEAYRAMMFPGRYLQRRSRTSAASIASKATLEEAAEAAVSDASRTKSDAGSHSVDEDDATTLDGSERHQKLEMRRKDGISTNKGALRATKALLKSPMDVAMGMTKGLRNLPKVWGDDTVRPAEQITDFTSGAKTAGKELGLGWYDGITGLITQPWKGAQKDGVGGFVKGFGKGMAGFMFKPLAGSVGILAYPMKGVHKGLQNMLGGNVQEYLVASRAAQGYEEWQQADDMEKEEVLRSWRVVQKMPKGRRGEKSGVDTSMSDREHHPSAMRGSIDSNRSDLESSLGQTEADDDAFDRAMVEESKTSDKLVVAQKGAPRHDSLHDSHHTDSREAQRHHNEKTAQESLEEELVIEYVKKQSLLDSEKRST